MNSIKYEEITITFLKKYNNCEIAIILDNEEFYVKLALKKDKNKLVVFSNGAVNREKKTPPIFMRSTWADEIEASCIYIDDKTIHGGNVRIGWGIGRHDRHFINDYSKIVKKIVSILGIKAKNIIYFGSSAGGFMSLLLASKHMYTTAIVNNPQTNVFNYKKGHVDEVCNHVFPNLSMDEIRDSFNERFSVVETFLKEKYIPRIHYYQNNQYEVDMKSHFNPFVNELKNNDISERKIIYYLYNNSHLAHDPLPKDTTIANINHILSNNHLRY